MTYSIPNLLTFLRILIIPLLVFVYYFPPNVIGMRLAALLFAIAALTDWLDGYLARKLNQTSKLGAFLDPIADKLIVVTVLVMIADEFGKLSILIPALIIIGREIAVSGLREWMSELGYRGSVSVSILGKIKTTAQMASLFLLLYRYPILGLPTFEIGVWLLYLAAALTLWSMLVYFRRAIKAFG
jgi:CDP-diacylglycerol--glycerol-3-phosphate 3-phosphatidyltransferase